MPSLQILPGHASPLGVTQGEDGDTVNFAVFARGAHAVDLCLFDGGGTESARIRLHSREGDVWHTGVQGLSHGQRYGYRVHGPWKPEEGQVFNAAKLLLDPRARLIDGPSAFHPSMISCMQGKTPQRDDSGPHAPKCILYLEPFDWKGDTHPRRPWMETIIYETHIKGLTKQLPGVPEHLRGTYAGLAHEAARAHLKELGITAVQLLPVHHHLDDGFLLKRDLVNYWGYNTIGFCAPEARYAASGDAVAEFREMVRSLHADGIEVILDVVYNHTGEAGLDGPTCLFRGFGNASHYHTPPDKPGVYRDFTGCGNSLDLNHAHVLRFVLDSLRYWVEEMHVDGFRFDLAVTLGRTYQGFCPSAPFFAAVAQDPVLSRTKLIAEPWDLGLGGYQLGNFPVDWSELNGKYRDVVRRFWRGEGHTQAEFASRICASEAEFAHNSRGARASVNLITSHDGFTLADLVSYEHKHNLSNGEDNRDGDNHNLSRNHGVEGPTEDLEILAVRRRQVRNLLGTLFLSQGVPFLLAGDEIGRTQGGNNNSYCQDNPTSWHDWNLSEDRLQLLRYVKRLIAFRRKRPTFRKRHFFTGEPLRPDQERDIAWYTPAGQAPTPDAWHTTAPGAFAAILHPRSSHFATFWQPLPPKERLWTMILFNARSKEVRFTIPGKAGAIWTQVLDTMLEEAFPEEGAIESKGEGETITVSPSSMQVWESPEC